MLEPDIKAFEDFNNKKYEMTEITKIKEIDEIDKLISEMTQLNISEDNIPRQNITEFTKKPKKYIIAVDNDECIGSWNELSLLYNIIKTETKKTPDIDTFTDIMIKTKCIRPYMSEFYKKLLKLKNDGIIYKIYMFTAASNFVGWVSYLSQLLEKWYGEKIYDGIIYQEMIKEWHIFNKTEYVNKTGYIKNMNMIREIIDFYDEHDSDDFHFIAIDDRPSNIINGTAIGVSPFRVAINLYEVIRFYYPKKFNYLIRKHADVINEPWLAYLQTPHLYTNTLDDVDILLGMDELDKIINNT